jgi:uncharacterized protein involved in type VI secretion and phage assembly
MSKARGVTVGVVTNTIDPEGQGRILVNLAILSGRNQAYWAPVASFMAGSGRGAWFMPEIGDEALVAFLNDNVEQPYIIGFTWNGQDAPPSSNQRERMFRSYNGHTIRFLDSTPGPSGAGAITIEDANGNVITMSNGKIHLKATSELEIEAGTISFIGPNQSWRRVVSPNNNPI